MVKKGTGVHVMGRIRNRSYTDKSQVKRWVSEILVDEFSCVDKLQEAVAPAEPPQSEPEGEIPL